MPSRVPWEAAGLCKNASMTFLQKRSMLEVGEESLAGLKGTFSFQRLYTRRKCGGVSEFSQNSKVWEIKGLCEGPQPCPWGLCHTRLAVLTSLPPYGSQQGRRTSLIKEGSCQLSGVCFLIVREKPAERQVIIRFWESWPCSVGASQCALSSLVPCGIPHSWPYLFSWIILSSWLTQQSPLGFLFWSIPSLSPFLGLPSVLEL